MNLLSTLYTLAQAKAADQEASTPLIGEGGYLEWWQILLILVLIGLIIFYMMYKKKQNG